jgi:hypothetical protein
VRPEPPIRYGYASCIAYIPVTHRCVTPISSGIPVGVQMAWLSRNNTGIPFAVTRRAAVTHWAVTHGPLAAGGGGNVQPAIV